MVFQTVFLFCVSISMCATKDHCQTQSNEEASVTAASVAVTEAAVVNDSEDVAKDDEVTAEGQVGDFLRAESEEHSDDDNWSPDSIRHSFQTMQRYFEFVVELLGGQYGVCEYRCKQGDSPEPRPGYRIPEPNGCSSSLVGFQLDLGIPTMTNCCNQLDVCYDTCGSDKYNCDATFRSCLHSICSDLKKSLGFVLKVQACESMADALYNTVWILGCRPYMNSQRAACVCKGEDRDEL